MRTTLKLLGCAALVAATAGSPLTVRATGPALAGPQFSSIGPLAFGPNNVLFAADRQAATIFAVDLGAQASGSTEGVANVAGLQSKIAAMLGTARDEVTITDLAIHPVSHNAFVAVMRGQGPAAQAALVRVDGGGKIELVSFENLKFTSVTLPNPAAVSPTGRGGRAQSVMDMGFANGKLYVSGLSNEEFASKLWAVPYPFATTDQGTSVEIFHGNHGRLETRAPVMAFLPWTINNQPHIIASYTCTPLVKFAVDTLKTGTKVVGTTIAEFGAGNQPLDMISYQKSGQTYLLMSNSSRGVMKIPTADFATATAITSPVATEKAGIAYETIAAMTGVEQLDKLDASRSVVIARAQNGDRDLSAVALP